MKYNYPQLEREMCKVLAKMWQTRRPKVQTEFGDANIT